MSTTPRPKPISGLRSLKIASSSGGRVKYIHPDCGFWMLRRPIADAKIRALAKGRDLFEGRSATA